MTPCPLRVLPAALAAVLVLLAAAPEARADEWVVVLDADEMPEAEALPEAVTALREALARRKQSLRFVAARHPLLALRAVVADAGDDEPQQVVFAGAFRAMADPDEDRLEKARSRWAGMPPGSRLFPLEGVTEDALGTLEGLRGLVAAGALVLELGVPAVEAAPFSPLDPEASLEAIVRLRVTALRLASGAPSTPEALRVAPAADDDTVEKRTAEENVLAFRVRRPLAGARTGALVFRAPEAEGVVLLADVPANATWTWDRLEPDLRVRAADGGAAEPARLTDVEADAPREARYRVEATVPVTQGEPPRPAVHVDGVAREVAGLRTWLTPWTRRDAEVAESVLHVRYAPRPASPQDVEGEIRIGSARIPFHASSDAGRATLVATAPDAPFALPLSRDADAVALEVVPANGNMPATASFELTCEPAAYAERVRLRLFQADGTEQRVAPGGSFRLPTGEALRARVELLDLDAWGALDAGRLQIRPADQDGIAVTGTLVLPYRFRQARLVVEDEAPRYRLADGEVVAVAPLRLRVDADGGDGAWLLTRLASPPRVVERGSATLSDWEVVDEGTGRWRVEATGAWRGIEPKPFDADKAGITFDVEWDGGLAPLAVQAEVEVPARWGTRGWVFVGLAVLAIALGVVTFLQLRPAPVRGTLLYAVEGMERTVGRVDLTPVGRRATALRADERGRVDLGETGDAIALIRPTRVGAMLEIPDEAGEVERRLLVDGLSVRTGRHTLRYVSGDADDVEAAIPLLDVPDLLGPEFDLESGTVDALPQDSS